MDEEVKNSNCETKKIEQVLFSKSTSIGRRKNQQDYAIIPGEDVCTSDKYICVLCDGMGGLEGGEIASKAACEHIFNSFSLNKDSIDNKIDFFSEAIEQADEIVSNLKNENGDRLDAGSTLVSVIVDNDSFTWASVGDSRIYLLRGDKMEQLTSDQNYGQVLLKKLQTGTITIEQANADPMKDALTNYLGINGLSEIDLSNENVPFEENDVLLLCSDGLYRTLEDFEIINIVKENINNIPLATYLLVEQAIKKEMPFQDNTTAILIKYSNKKLQS